MSPCPPPLSAPMPVNDLVVLLFILAIFLLSTCPIICCVLSTCIKRTCYAMLCYATTEWGLPDISHVLCYYVAWTCDFDLWPFDLESVMYSTSHVSPTYQFLLSYDYLLLSYDYWIFDHICDFRPQKTKSSQNRTPKWWVFRNFRVCV